MFDIPDAKCIRRADLRSDSPSSERSDPDTLLIGKLQDRLASIYESPHDHPDLIGNPNNGNVTNEDKWQTEHADDEEHEFRLFASLTDPSNPTRNRVILKSPTPPYREPGFMKARRPDAYYFTGPLKPELQQQYRQAAISGDRIAQGLNARWPGFELPWRVTSIKAADAKKATVAIELIEKDNIQRRSRNGKKRRIAIRTKMAGKAEKERLANLSQQEKEAAEKEKRTRRNREKKVKKRRKEKMKKADITNDHG